jgi:DNA-binding response OmpR family regulator
VLLVDSDQAYRDAAAAALAAAGYEVLAAADSLAALDLIDGGAAVGAAVIAMAMPAGRPNAFALGRMLRIRCGPLPILFYAADPSTLGPEVVGGAPGTVMTRPADPQAIVAALRAAEGARDPS